MSPQEPEQKNDPLLASFLEAQNGEDEQKHLDHLIALVDSKIKAITKRSLNPNEVFQDAVLGVIIGLRNLKANPDSASMRDFIRYALVVASNARKEELRRERPQWHRLKGSLRYIMKTDRRFALWKVDGVGMFCGITQWRGRVPDHSRKENLGQLLEDLNGCETDILNGRDAQKLGLPELSHAIFSWIDSSIELDDLVTIIFDLKRLAKNTHVSIDHDEEGSLAGKLATSNWPHDLQEEWREHLERYLHCLWEGVVSLKSKEQRMAFLLNFDGAGHGLKLFQMYGAATLRRIGESLNLSEEHFERLWPQLGEKARRVAEGLENYDEKFALLWMFLPIEDKIIANMLGVNRQKVINLRSKARKHLNRNLAERGEIDVNIL